MGTLTQAPEEMMRVMRGMYLAVSCIVSRLRTMTRTRPSRGWHVLDCEGSSPVVWMRNPSGRHLLARMCAKTHFDSRPCRARPTFLFEVSLVQGPRGHLGLSGAENPESNEQGAGRQRAPRAAEFVSKTPHLRRRIANY